MIKMCKCHLTRRCFHTIWLFTLTITIFISLFDQSKSKKHGQDSFVDHGADCVNSELFHKDIVEKYYEKRKHWKTSNLGTIIFKNISPKMFSSREEDVFLIMVWKNWIKLVEKHAYNYEQSKTSTNNRPKICPCKLGTNIIEKYFDERSLKQVPNHNNLLNNCSVKNCKFSGRSDHFYIADAVIMTGDFIPKLTHRNLNQRWIFLSEEPPMRAAFAKPPYREIKDLANIFNWTMSYRSDSDIPIPYGRTLPLKFPNDVYMDDAESALSQIVPYWSEKQFATLPNILLSNCSIKRRMNYLAELKKYLKIDVHGNCSDMGLSVQSCPGNKKIDCLLTKDYLFYLVFESASCRQYITEKCFLHGYSKGAVPVIMGPPFDDCEALLPPNSFLHVANYKTPAELAAHMHKISENYDELLSFHAWRTHFQIENEHGYFGAKSSFFCRICEALNYNDGGSKTYGADDLELFFSKKLTCDLKYV